MVENSTTRDRGRVGSSDRETDGLYNSPGGAGQVFRKTLVQTLTVLVVVGVAVLVKETIYIFLLVFAGILLAVLLETFARQFMGVPHVPHWLGVTVILVLLAGLLLLMILLVVPMLSEEASKLTAQLKQSVDQLLQWLQKTAGGEFLVGQFSSLEEQIAEGEGVWARATGFFSSTIAAVTGMLIIVVVGVFIAYNPGMYTRGFLHLFPVSHRDRTAEVMATMGATLRWWLLGQMISMAILAISTWIMLALLGVPQALTLGLLTGLMTFVPYLGPLISLVPILLVSFLESPITAVYVLILYMGIQNVEANVIMPIVFHKTAHIPPAIGLISQILFGSLFGVLGFILAVPLMAVILEFVKMVYIEDVLGDKESTGKPSKTSEPVGGGSG